jgi:hypothetical protein
MEIGWLLGGLFFFVTLVFIVIAVAFPEWVGITGKVAKDFEKQQRGNDAPTDNPYDKS